MRTRFYLIGLLCIMSYRAVTQNINYSEHIAPIIYSHCTSCHRTGEIAPFPLTSYSEVSLWATTIQYVTSIKYMPPWKPDPTISHYQQENYLSDAQIQLIADWVAAGTPQGDPALEPPLPVFPSGSQIGQPDLVLSFAKSYTHIGNNQDEYRYFAIPTGLTEDKDLIGLEVRPGNTKIAHHAIIKEDTTGAAAAADAADSLYGYSSNLNTNSQNATNLPGYVPGVKPILYSHGIAQKLHAGSYLSIQYHYAPYPTDETDSSTFNLFFAPDSAQRYVHNYIMLPFAGTLTNGPFIIPANQVKNFHGTYTIPADVSLLNIGPHMHLLGQNWNVYAIKPNGDTAHLIRINEWDFNWQGGYSYKSPIILPAGTVVHAFATYDNTTNNPHNPYNPPQTITWGENTSDEMFYLPFNYVSYQPGDENIVFDTTSATGIENAGFYTLKDKLYPIAPNPANSMIKLGFTLSQTAKVSIKLVDEKGTETKTLIDGSRSYLTGWHTYDMSTENLATGVYTVQMQANSKSYSQKLIVVH